LHLCAPSDHPSNNLDNIEIGIKNPVFDTVCAPLTRELLARAVPRRSVILTSVGEEFNMIGHFCREQKIPCVYVAELNLRTRHQIVYENQPNRIRRLWQKVRQTQQEIAQRRAISISDAVQCNGLPTFEAYEGISKSPLLFFDSRVEDGMLANREGMLTKIHRRSSDDKIHLVFSGRLNRIKGVDDLPVLVSHLKEMKVPFEMTICGDGEYMPQLCNEISERGLGDHIRLSGALDFKSELMPFVSNYADLFICCHRQGDPSCTYIETMACGVPIVGYDNDAFRLLAKHAKVGWSVPMADTMAIARLVAELHNRPDLIAEASDRSLRFASENTFPKSFSRRIHHLKAVAAPFFQPK
jgi:colanic acid/amylovoran biosynthesis glycosyltransferase